MSQLPELLKLFIGGLMGFLICTVSIPRVIAIAKVKRLFDRPDGKRKIHKVIVPNLGGVGIFLAYIIITSLLIDTRAFQQWNFCLSATFILFILGVKDDIVSLSPAHKLLAQLLSAIITVIFADIRLRSLQGIMGIYELPYAASVAFTIVGCVFVTNAFNLIDGIDGLAGTITVLCTGIIGTSLTVLGNYASALMAFTLLGSVVGFLRHNISPASIFMGDSGSLFIGYTVSVLAIILINEFRTDSPLSQVVSTNSGALIVVLSILVIPVFDSFRVFIARIAKGNHPFKADRTHLHHFLLDCGFTHSRTVMILATANLLVVTVALAVQNLDPNLALAILVTVSLGLFAILYLLRKKRLQITDQIKQETLARAHAMQVPTLVSTNGESAMAFTNSDAFARVQTPGRKD